MAITSVSSSESPESIQTPLLHGVVQGMELAERFAYFGIASNLITYLTGPLGQSTATAAENVNAWTGASFVFPLIGAFVADSFLGRCRTIVVASISSAFCVRVEEKSAFQRIGQIFVATIRNWRSSCSAIALEEELCGPLPHHSTEKFNLSEVEEAKAVLRLVPIWDSCLLFGVVDVQFSTLCKKQGAKMDRSISPGFDIPPASLQSVTSLFIVLFIPIYDRIIVPLARDLTGEPSGTTMLQRIGTGMFFFCPELEVAREYGLVDKPNVTVPMTIWWLIPQYVIAGVADALSLVGVQEFFYDQVPRELRSVGLSLYISTYGVVIIARDSWFANNLNRAHLDYIYWLLAGLSTVQFVVK
ncbi:hypothetical protein P3X46_021589 [Hevea brasiliensis]|uniref:Uncharacterized protein n=1 Tax=Hevea brasiliensis TaxID=3981 RepID=A0ABQ9LIZ5_HEVBR|nr:hypothetical protein P3X46_021589 [Hevea brasiliensis]